MKTLVLQKLKRRVTMARAKGRATMASTSSHMEPIWKELPSEILEDKILPLLPVASLWRFRAVSRKWKATITHPKFAALHAIASPAEDFALIDLRTDLPFNCLGGWEILNVAKDRVFPLSHGFLMSYSRWGTMDGEHWIVLAADGGLMLIWYSMIESNPSHTLLVCNPLLKKVKEIPFLRDGWVHANNVVMSTNRATMEYEIVVFQPMVNHYQVNCIDVFQSKTGTWTRIVNPTVPSQEWWFGEGRFVKYRSRFYRLSRRGSNLKPELVAFDKTTGVSSLIPLTKPFFTVWFYMKVLELVVSEDRLFCLSKWGISEHECRFVEIFEIFPERHDCQFVASMPSEILKWLHGDDKYEAWGVREIMYYYLDPVAATGCASSILFCSCIGRSVGYDMASNSWRVFCDSVLLKQHLGIRLGRYLECKNLGLSLCPP